MISPSTSMYKHEGYMETDKCVFTLGRDQKVEIGTGMSRIADTAEK